jgi:N-terminal 7TM region of histidine kinase
MHWQVTPYSYLLLVVAAMSAALVFFAWRRRGTPGAEALALLMTGVCIWAAGYALELSGADLPTKIFGQRPSTLASPRFRLHGWRSPYSTPVAKGS